MILKTSRLIPWCSCLPRRPNCWVVATTLSELQILCLNHRVSCSSRQFLLPLLILVELCHVQWKGCSLCSSSVYQALSSLLSGFPVHNIRCVWFCVCVCVCVCVCLFFFSLFPNRKPKSDGFRSVLVFRAVFQLLYCCCGRDRKPTKNASHYFSSQLFSVSKLCTIQRLRLIGSLWVPLFISQSECFVHFLFSALNYLYSASCFLKTAFFLTNQNCEIFLYLINNIILTHRLFNIAFSFLC